jgi:hypothetical protein
MESEVLVHKRLNDRQRLEIISKLLRPYPPGKRDIAREYDIVDMQLESCGINANRSSSELRIYS